MPQKPASLQMCGAYPYIDVAVQLIPRVCVVFLTNMRPGFPGWITDNCRSRGVVNGVRGARQPKIQVLGGYCPAMSRLNGQADPFRSDVLPPEQVSYAEAVVCRGIH